jgi:hypothetical protein
MPGMSALATFFLVLLGVGLIGSGAVAIARRQASASTEGADERSFEGRSAVLLGGVWIVLGLLLIFAVALPDSSLGRSLHLLLR